MEPRFSTRHAAPRGLRRLDELEARVLSDKGLTGWGPFFSPDGKQVGFFEPGKLLRVSVDGGTPVTVADIEVDFVGGANWGSHDHIVFGAPTPEGSHGLYRVPATGGRPQLIATTEANETYWLTPQWIDNGNAVLCTVVRTSPDGPRFQVVAVSVATGQRRLLIDDGWHGFDAGGILVYWRNDALFATNFDSRRLEITGPHVPAWDNVGPAPGIVPGPRPGTRSSIGPSYERCASSRGLTAMAGRNSCAYLLETTSRRVCRLTDSEWP